MATEKQAALVAVEVTDERGVCFAGEVYAKGDTFECSENAAKKLEAYELCKLTRKSAGGA